MRVRIAQALDIPEPVWDTFPVAVKREGNITFTLCIFCARLLIPFSDSNVAWCLGYQAACQTCLDKVAQEYERSCPLKPSYQKAFANMPNACIPATVRRTTKRDYERALRQARIPEVDLKKRWPAWMNLIKGRWPGE